MGYIYAFSSRSIPGILKIGITERTPEIELTEINNSDIPYLYILELKIKVINLKQKEKALYKLLLRYVDQTNPERWFFRISIEDLKLFFDIIDEEKNEEEKKEQLGCRDMRKCFRNSQRISHTIPDMNRNHNTWIGYYDSSLNKITRYGELYTLSQFALSHYKAIRQDIIKPTVNAWRDCKCEVNRKWVSTYNL
jgi:hypothetical protein